MRVLLLNQAYWPDTVATAQHADDLGRFLVQRGHEVSVVASRAKYGERGSGLPRYEVHEGVRVWRVGAQLFGKRGLIARLLDFAVFYAAAAFRCALLPRQDVVVCFTTPPFIALVGVMLKVLKGTRVVYWTMDLYPDVAVAGAILRKGSWSWRLFSALDRLCLRESDRVVALGPCMERVLLEKGARQESIRVIPPWSASDEVPAQGGAANPLRARWNLGDRLTILYAGNFGLGHEMEALAQAIELLRDDDRIRWLLIGSGKAKPALEARVRACGASNVVLAGPLPRHDLPALLDSGDLHLVTHLPGWEGLLVPSKFFGVLAAGKPVIWVGPAGTICGQIIKRFDCGFEIRPEDGRGLADRIIWALDHRDACRAAGTSGRRAHDEEYCARRACQRWHDLLVDIVAYQRSVSPPQP